jgi:NitT/TauT family transport system ATP-binding protein
MDSKISVMSAPVNVNGPSANARPDLPRVSVKSVTRDFSGTRLVHALGPIDLDIAEHEWVSIVGPSGCGKSTLLRVVAGLLAPTQGSVVVAHRNGTRTLAAMVPQDSSVLPWFTVAENVRFGLDVAQRGTANERREVVDHWLARLGLTDFADVYPNTLSGGMKQRVVIARALAVEPEMLLMDEPFAGLDAQLRTLMQQDLLVLWEADRRTVLLVTHDIEEAIMLSDRVVVCSARPGVLKGSFEIPFPRPRDWSLRGTAEFAALHESIWQVVRTEVSVQMSNDGNLNLENNKKRRRWGRKAR